MNRASSLSAAAGVRRGISLIEALVAMAVMAFGMLGVVGLQATLRSNADLSKQRSEATRIAQEEIERWRNFSLLDTPAGGPTASRRAFADVAPFGPVNTTAYTSTTTNTTYSVSGAASAAGQHRTLTTSVSWQDRTGATQTVRLISGLTKVAPELGATAVAPSSGFAGIRDIGRQRGIPPQAKNFGDGTSGFRPPQAVSGTVAWLFNNTTGVFTICTTTVTNNILLVRTDLVSCGTTPYQLISGLIRFDTVSAPTPSSVLDPTTSLVNPLSIRAQVQQSAPLALAGNVACFHDFASNYVEFFCPVQVEPITLANPQGLRWSGTLRIDPTTMTSPAISGSVGDSNNGNRKVCRYRAAATYASVTVPLADQNLLVIRAGNGASAYGCPTSATGPTWPHQPT